MADTQHLVRFPGESEQYRTARNDLLEAEIALRARVEEVAALRRRLPLGGAVREDYVFDEGSPDLEDKETVRRVKLSELFAPGKDSLIAYSFMYGAKAEKPCPMCTSVLDAMNGSAVHVAQRANLVVIAKSPLQRIRAFARSRGWNNLRLLSSETSSYNRDYHAETPDDKQIPALNVFVRRDGRIHHAYNTEMLYIDGARFPGQDSRHVDMIWPLWNLLDLVPEGRGDFYPKLSYEER